MKDREHGQKDYRNASRDEERRRTKSYRHPCGHHKAEEVKNSCAAVMNDLVENVGVVEISVDTDVKQFMSDGAETENFPVSGTARCLKHCSEDEIKNGKGKESLSEQSGDCVTNCMRLKEVRDEIGDGHSVQNHDCSEVGSCVMSKSTEMITDAVVSSTSFCQPTDVDATVDVDHSKSSSSSSQQHLDTASPLEKLSRTGMAAISGEMCEMYGDSKTSLEAQQPILALASTVNIHTAVGVNTVAETISHNSGVEETATFAASTSSFDEHGSSAR
jgi:hypothetical protein